MVVILMTNGFVDGNNWCLYLVVFMIYRAEMLGKSSWGCLRMRSQCYLKNGLTLTDFIVFCRVVLQRHRLVQKGSNVRRLIKRRIDARKNDNFDELVQETIRCVRQSVRRRKETLGSGFDHVVQVFTRLMWRGKVRAAARWITERGSNGVLLLTDLVDGSTDKAVIDVLKEKHPYPGMIDDSVCLEDDDLPVLMDVDVTGGHIERLARAFHGGVGPGGTTSSHWQSFLLCYGAQSAKLRDAVAALTCLLANSIVNWDMIRASMPPFNPEHSWSAPHNSSISIPVAKAIALPNNRHNTSPTPIGRITGFLSKAISLLDNMGAIHSFGSIFESKPHEGYGVLMVDAKNAFNSVNRAVSLLNARVLWPRCSRFLFNTYRGYSSLWINGSSDPLFSREGITQGDPLSMLFYAVALLPLIRLLKSSHYTQSWFADDSACVGSLENVRSWFKQLMDEGPKYGYFPEPSKSVLVVDQEFKDKAELLFGEFGVKVVSGSRFLGEYIGDDHGRKEYVKMKVQSWVDSVYCLSDAAKQQPQAACAALVKSIQCEWVFCREW